MKKLIIATGIIIYGLFAVSVFATDVPDNQSEVISVGSVQEKNPKAEYLLKEQEGFLVVIYNETGEVIEKTDTLVSSLPAIDREKLKMGVEAVDKKELFRLLQDYCS